MDNHEEESDCVSGFIEGFEYQRPAISITEKVGDSEITTDFATLEDYAGWKALQD